MNEGPDAYNWRARAWYQVRRGWVAFLTVALLLAGIVACDVIGLEYRKARGEPTAATIIDIYNTQMGRTYPPRGVVVVARSNTGIEGSMSVPPDRITGCKIGDPVLAERVGNRLRIEPWPCRHGK